MSRNFADVLRMLQQGAFVDECSEKLAGLIAQVRDTKRGGKLTITLDVKPAAGDAFTILPAVTDKTPVDPPEAEIYWQTDLGAVTRENPKQQKLDLQQVDAPARRVIG